LNVAPPSLGRAARVRLAVVQVRTWSQTGTQKILLGMLFDIDVVNVAP
jgi:hypothetical protein